MKLRLPSFSPQALIDALAITRFTCLHLVGEDSITLKLGEHGDQGLGRKVPLLFFHLTLISTSSCTVNFSVVLQTVSTRQGQQCNRNGLTRRYILLVTFALLSTAVLNKKFIAIATHLQQRDFLHQKASACSIPLAGVQHHTDRFSCCCGSPHHLHWQTPTKLG